MVRSNGCTSRTAINIVVWSLRRADGLRIEINCLYFCKNNINIKKKNARDKLTIKNKKHSFEICFCVNVRWADFMGLYWVFCICSLIEEAIYFRNKIWLTRSRFLELNKGKNESKTYKLVCLFIEIMAIRHSTYTIQQIPITFN